MPKIKLFMNLIIAISLLCSCSSTHSNGSEAPKVCIQKSKKERYLINTSVVTLWKQPGVKRNIDQYVLTNPVQMKKWTSNMNDNEKLWLVGNIETEGLYGQEITLLQTKDKWSQIALKDQLTKKNLKGYPGWVPSNQITLSKANTDRCSKATVKSKTALLYNRDKKTEFMEVSFLTQLPVVFKSSIWTEVNTPDNKTKWIRTKDIKVDEKQNKPTGQEIVNTGKLFLNLPYLWAGTSGFGYDCSGFTYSIYKAHGILIPRDSTEQFAAGKVIVQKDLEPGDLVFFAYNKGKGTIHHVAIYAGNGFILQSPNTGGNIEIISMHTYPYNIEFAGGRRYIK